MEDSVQARWRSVQIDAAQGGRTAQKRHGQRTACFRGNTPPYGRAVCGRCTPQRRTPLGWYGERAPTIGGHLGRSEKCTIVHVHEHYILRSIVRHDRYIL